MCGNYDGSSDNDYQDLDGNALDNYADFANAWVDPMESRPLEPVSTRTVHPCTLVEPSVVSKIVVLTSNQIKGLLLIRAIQQ